MQEQSRPQDSAEQAVGPTAIAAVRFSTAMGRALKLWRLIWSLQTYAAHGSSSAERGILVGVYDAGREIIARPDFGIEEQRQSAEKMLPAAAAAAAANTRTDALTAIAAASVVFAHSLIDAAVEEYCAVSAMMCPNDWLEFVDETSVTLRDARQEQLDALVEKAISQYLKKLANKSLVNKIKTLQQVCRPGSAEILKDYAFDAERMDRFDKLRHELVHQGVFEPAESDVAADLEYVQRTNVYLSALITHRYGLLIGPEAMAEAAD